MRRNQAKDDELPVDLAKSLNEHFIDLMYFRFEFARGATTEVITAEVFDYRLDKKAPGRFTRIFGRPRFIGGPKSPTYLDDLKADLKSAGRHSGKAQEWLRLFVEENRCPLSWSEDYRSAPVQSPFFPRAVNEEHPSRTVKAKTRCYCFQLFELQDFLIREIGVTPGALLPVWIGKEAAARSPHHYTDLPVISCLPVRKSLVEVLVGYLVWEHGGYYGEIHGRDMPRESRLKKTANDWATLDRALTWGRALAFREGLIVDLTEAEGITFEKFRKKPYHERVEILKRLKNPAMREAVGEEAEAEWREFMSALTGSEAEERLMQIKRTGKTDSSEPDLIDVNKLQPANLRDPRSAERKLAMDITLVSKLHRTIKPYAEYLLLEDGFRDLW